MLRFHADKFVSILNAIVSVETLTQDPVALAAAKDIRTHQANKVMQLGLQLRNLQLPVAVKKAEQLEFYLGKTDATGREKAWGEMISGACKELRERIEHELDGKAVYSIPAMVELLEPSAPLFGKAVDDKFPTAAEEISEAGKCLALGRSTASVFHLMRTMECAVRVLSEKIGISDTERVWGNLLSDMAVKIEKLPKGNERNQWSEAHTLLYHVKQAWRNDTMHPKEVHTPEQAKSIFEAVKVFMQHLATLS